jgi:hypothetical protein
MLSHSQTDQLFALNKDRTSFFSLLPLDVANLISCDYDPDPHSEIAIALRHAASGTKADIDVLVEMVKTNPRLLLQAGDVVTRGGVFVKRIKLYEFFLGEGDPDGAKQIEFGFEKIVTGKEEREHQYERYRPHIEALAKQIEAKQPAYDLRPLIEMIKNSSAADITEALTINDPDRVVTRNTELRKELAKFRRAVRPKTKTCGLHYKHYTTLMQAFDLLDNEWQALSNNYTTYDKCRLVWRQIIGYLERSLPAVDRFALARAFDDAERTPNYKYDRGAFLDTSADDSELSGIGFDEGIFGGGRADVRAGVRGGRVCLENTYRAKTSVLQNLCSHSRNSGRPGV